MTLVQNLRLVEIKKMAPSIEIEFKKMKIHKTKPLTKTLANSNFTFSSLIPSSSARILLTVDKTGFVC